MVIDCVKKQIFCVQNVKLHPKQRKDTETIKRSVFFDRFGKYLKKVWKVVQTWCEVLLIKKVFHVCLTNSNSIQLCGMYINFANFHEISFLKEVHNVRKWPNLRSVEPGNV